jgi:hypothetical protein
MTDDLVKRLRDFDPHNMHEWEAVDLAADRIEKLEEALAELSDMVRCHCDEAFRDRDLQDPDCNCDSMDAVRVVIARIEWLERELSLADDQRREWEHHCKTAEATVATLTKKMEAMRGAAEEAAEVIHKAYVSATMEAVNAGPSHPLKDNIDKWRVRCLRAEEALRAALTMENQTNG